MTGNTRLTREQAQRIHAKTRARERYGFWLHDQDVDRIIEMIQSGQTEIIRRISCRLTIRKLTYDGVEMRVCYDSKRKQLASVLPLEDDR